MRGRDPAPLTRFGVDYLVKQVAEDARIGRTVNGNALRRRYVVAAVAAGADVESVSRHVGHADPRTTRRHLDA
jgi:site-specific recombinase XerD